MQIMAESAARLSPNEILLLESLTTAMVSAGLWESATHLQDLGCDYFEVQVRNTYNSTLSIGVLSSGRYFCMDHRNGAIWSGDTLSGVLERSGISPRRHDVTTH